MTKKTPRLNYFDNTFNEHNRSRSGNQQRLAEEVVWMPDFKRPTLQAKRFNDTQWHDILDLSATDQCEVINTSAQALLGLVSWYKHVNPGQSPELGRSKHFQILSRFCSVIPAPRDIRIPYYVEDGHICSALNPVYCPPGYFEQ